MVKRSTGKTIGEHVIDSISDETLKQTYFPEGKLSQKIIFPKTRPSKEIQ